MIRQTSKQFEPHADPCKHLMMCDKKAKSDKKLGKTKNKQAERKKVLRAAAKKNETDDEKEERKKKETERKRIWREQQKLVPKENPTASETKSQASEKKN